VTNRGAATRYARALFDVAFKEAGDAGAERAQEDLRAFADVVAGNEELWHVLRNPAIPAARKRALVDALLEGGGGAKTMSQPVHKLILMLAERDRLVLLPELVTAYGERLMDHQKVMRGEVTTAVPLAPEKLRALDEGLGRAKGRKVILSSRVDATILGGAVTRLGSMVYDGSVTTQLQRMKESLIESAQ
jgi:F-type H+-transporting ATPase subunit delta